MGDLERKKRADMATVPKMKPTRAVSKTSAPTKRPPRKRGGLVEEIGERVRRDPRREQD